MVVGTIGSTSMSFGSVEEAAQQLVSMGKAPAVTNAKANIKVALRGYEMKHGVQKPRSTAYGYSWKEVTSAEETAAAAYKASEEESSFSELDGLPVDAIKAAMDQATADSDTDTVEDEAPEVLNTVDELAHSKKVHRLFAKNFRQSQHDDLADYDAANPPKNLIHKILRNAKRVYQGCGDLVR